MDRSVLGSDPDPIATPYSPESLVQSKLNSELRASIVFHGILTSLVKLMALQTQFPVFAPPQLRPQPHRPTTEIRFSRWNNANAQKFIRHERTQKELEDQIRFEKRFDSALTIAHNYNPAPPHPTTFKSTGTPSAPSSPSIPGKASKYSKPPKHPSRDAHHPAFKPLSKSRKIPLNENDSQNPVGPNFRIDENGVSYEMPEAPFVTSIVTLRRLR
ncbi:CRS2-associated factor 1, chloroplastic [Sesamum angolense]|uniref:CRS2-associated factor 1, chloroplastic n=1 Tax=Sesamum angolense TaxID=2727404 RepID=A0AAE1WE53_9LAMI|nr:CRS2-associated factor 1, chloroplastic [Sesamum angolense]